MSNLNYIAIARKDISLREIKGPQNERLNLGSGQVAVNWDALYGGATAGSDPHPGQWGWNRIAERLWEVLKPLLTRPPT